MQKSRKNHGLSPRLSILQDCLQIQFYYNFCLIENGTEASDHSIQNVFRLIFGTSRANRKLVHFRQKVARNGPKTLLQRVGTRVHGYITHVSLFFLQYDSDDDDLHQLRCLLFCTNCFCFWLLCCRQQRPRPSAARYVSCMFRANKKGQTDEMVLWIGRTCWSHGSRWYDLDTVLLM